MKSFLLSALSLALASISLHADPRSEGSLNQTPLRTTETLTGAEFLLLAQGDPSGNTRRVEESISIADFNALYSGSAEFSYFANPKASDYGAFGDGASHQAITAFATLGEAQLFIRDVSISQRNSMVSQFRRRLIPAGASSSRLGSIASRRLWSWRRRDKW